MCRAQACDGAIDATKCTAFSNGASTVCKRSLDSAIYRPTRTSFSAFICGGVGLCKDMASIESRSAQLAKALILVLGSCALSLGGADAAMPLTLTSSAFKSGAPIPSLYTCEGKDI